jgi:hypothetical protein
MGGMKKRKPRASLVLLLQFAFLLMGCGRGGSSRYGLPIVLGSSSDQVRRVLGGPNAVVKATEIRRALREFGAEPSVLPTTDNITEWYYSSGIAATFDRDRLLEIALPTYTSYPGFLVYSGTVVNGVRLTDSKEIILGKLGMPEKVEDDPLPEGTDPDVPEVWPKESRYYWRFPSYVVRVDYLRQAQKADDTHTFRRNAVVSIQVYK